jgi:putative transposase
VHTLREILDAIFYILRSGCAWRLLPHDFPPWKTIHHYFRKWRIDGTWERMHADSCKRVRVRMRTEILSRAQAWWIASRSRAPG